jgi:hypothetical protein
MPGHPLLPDIAPYARPELMTKSCTTLAAAALLLMAAAPAAQAQDLTGGIFNILGLGNDEKEAIDYRERPPLVVPPKAVLRPPVEGASSRAGNWPNDPDAAARRAAAAESRRPAPGDISERSEGRLLSQRELAAGRRAGRADPNPLPHGAGVDVKNSDMTEFYTSGAHRRTMRVAEENQLVPGQEAPRRFLTDPPPGLRLPAGNAPIRATPDRPVIGRDISSRPETDVFR